MVTEERITTIKGYEERILTRMGLLGIGYCGEDYEKRILRGIEKS